MAANFPAKLKAADLTKFCVRAAQLESAKPVVAYWCEYWIANQILTKGLHNGDNETLQYATGLMDKLERIKADNATNDAIIDDMAGQAYVEHFASETFDRADRAVHANKVTKQTADTFQAAATFFELVNIWEPPDGEIQAKIKYAKWNAVRIAKALKEGKDPNESNPKPQPEEEKPVAQLDFSDIDQQQPSVHDTSRHATVQDMPDEQEILGEQSFHYDPKAPDEQVHFKGDIAPPLLSSHEAPLNDRKDSVGGGFFPEIPTLQDGDSPSASAPLFHATEIGLPPPPGRLAAPQDYYRDSPGVQPSTSNIPHIPYPRPAATQPALLQSVATNTNTMDLDEEAIAEAQKHARWAISALNFEDTDTAIKELREALRTLGAEV